MVHGTQCAACGKPNPQEAQFCGRCGSRLAALELGSNEAGSSTQDAIRIKNSAFSSALDMTILGLIASGLVIFATFEYYYYVDSISLWIGIAVGVTVALGLTSRFLLVGRLPSAAGVLCIVIGLVWGAFDSGENDSIIVGVGVGILFQVKFWKHIATASPVTKGTVAVAGIIGIIFGAFDANSIGSLFPELFVALIALIALLVGLPSVLIVPVLRTSNGR